MKPNLLLKQTLLSCGIVISALIVGHLPSLAETNTELETNTLTADEVTEMAPGAIADEAPATEMPVAIDEADAAPTAVEPAAMESDPVAAEPVPIESMEAIETEPSTSEFSTDINADAAPDATAETVDSGADMLEAEGAIAETADEPDLLPTQVELPTRETNLTQDAAGAGGMIDVDAEPAESMDATGTAADLQVAPQTPGLEPATTNGTIPALTLPSSQAQLPGGLEQRYVFSYIGVGPNLGITGGPAIGETGFGVLSKIALNPYLSFRPSVLIEDEASFLLPVTYDFPIAAPGAGFAPFLGGGVAINTGDGDTFGLLLTGGVDVPISDTIAISAAANLAPFDDVDLGVVFGINYIFDSSTVITRSAEDVAADAATDLAQAIPPGRAVNPSFIGAGGNIGLGGDTALSDSAFGVFSKFTISDFVSVRPGLLFNDDVTLLLPVTYDFAPFTTDFITLAPYLGAGVALTFDNDTDVDLLLSAGVDIPITNTLALTSGVNFAVLDSFDIGVSIGLVYLFNSF
ncbi:MAG: hypothetical protein KME20_01925 [Kaiparowitsia implicata GSE-PSE-MK54-09C]|nr:hypothetical protein [Kaiparowitsia implicata GSE-PSE-MK54-09C]